MKKIVIALSEDNESTDAPYWLILDPKQNMSKDLYVLASQITGPFFSRDSAERHLKNRSHAYSKSAAVFCMSGYFSPEYKHACRSGIVIGAGE